MPLALFLVFVTTLVLSHDFGAAQPFLLIGVMTAGVVLPLAHRLSLNADISFFLIIPTVLSATQNVFLLLVASQISAGQLQFLVILNFVYSAILLAVLVSLNPWKADGVSPLAGIVGWCLFGIAGYGVLSAGIFGASPVSAFASLRNLVAPLVFCLIGLYASRDSNHRRYLGYIVILALSTIVFGLVERQVPHFWRTLGIDELWQKKGIPISDSTGLPANFYSSERLGGRQLRRMVGSFADPVNLGTFLLAAFVAAWFLKRRIIAVLVIAAFVLTISKGALIGLLVFLACWARQYRSRTEYALSIVVLGVAAVGFYAFTLSNSTGSTTKHIEGLSAALAELPRHPLGRGLGNIGVLAGLFGEGAQSGIAESGVGMVIGQLGVIGLLGYGVFFVALFWAARAIEPTAERVMVMSLLFAFVLNAAFNEVAMSPNSSAPYFIVIGLVLGRATRHDRPGNYGEVAIHRTRDRWTPIRGGPTWRS